MYRTGINFCYNKHQLKAAGQRTTRQLLPLGIGLTRYLEKDTHTAVRQLQNRLMGRGRKEAQV